PLSRRRREKERGVGHKERRAQEGAGRRHGSLDGAHSRDARRARGHHRGDEIMSTAGFRIWRGTRERGEWKDYRTEVSEGMVVLDAVHQIQAESASDLAARWNCKAGKCGSCSAEVNGMPRLMCMTRLDDLPLDEAVTIAPMKAFPLIKDLVTDVSWNFAVKK